ncbi:zona pellucida sperm-binding protein 4-like [Stigmatopora argus]
MKLIALLALAFAMAAAQKKANLWSRQTTRPTDAGLTCQVDAHHRIPCGPPGISPSQCQEIGCCFDGGDCFYGKHGRPNLFIYFSILQLQFYFQCTKDGQMIVVICKEATEPCVDLDSISLMANEPGCGAVDSTSAFTIYQFPVTACGSVVREEPGILVYENSMSAFYEVFLGAHGTITRDSRFELAIQCRYAGASVAALIWEAERLPAPPPVAAPGALNVDLRLGKGRRTVKGQMDEEVVFDYFYEESDYPVTKELREPIYVEVRIVGKNDPNLVLNLRRCWATGDSYPQSMPQWDLLLHGCPCAEGHYSTTVVPVDASSGLEYPSHHRRFFFRMFSFVSTRPADPSKGGPAQQQVATALRQKVFIHCETTVCIPHAGNNCEPQCFRMKRDLAGIKQTSGQSDSTLVSSLEIQFIQGN